VSDLNEARYIEEVERALAQPMTQGDWEIIKARFEKIERRLAILDDGLGTMSATAVRADEIVHAHQPYIDKLVRAQATDARHRVDGRTLLVLTWWVGTILAPRADVVEIETTPEQRREMQAAIANVKAAMEGADFEVRGG
jgi:hypothetical protein